MYQAFDDFLAMDTWHTREHYDYKRFFVALSKVVSDPKFSADELGRYMRDKKNVARDDEENPFNADIDHYVAAAWAVRDYLKANKL
jgi:hypothetical protein